MVREGRGWFAVRCRSQPLIVRSMRRHAEDWVEILGAIAGEAPGPAELLAHDDVLGAGHPVLVAGRPSLRAVLPLGSLSPGDLTERMEALAEEAAIQGEKLPASRSLFGHFVD